MLPRSTRRRRALPQTMAPAAAPPLPRQRRRQQQEPSRAAALARAQQARARARRRPPQPRQLPPRPWKWAARRATTPRSRPKCCCMVMVSHILCVSAACMYAGRGSCQEGGGGDSLPTRDCCTVAEWCLRSKRPRPKYKALPAVKEDGSSQQSTGSLLKCRVSGCAGPTCWPGPLQAWSPAVLCAQWQSAVRALRDSVSPAERRHQGAACPRHTAHHQHIT
jgi:hypothetical protein